jgi:acyl-CoA thioester hydrolase
MYTHRFTIPSESVDQNGHVNNVYYVQWMQDIAIKHYKSMGGISPTEALGATWVVRSHQIDYFCPAFVGDEIEARTWVANLRRVRSLRRYEFVRVIDSQFLARGETDWVFVNAQNGRPLAIPEEITRLFTLLSNDYD